MIDAVRVPRQHAIGAPGDGRSRALSKISAVRRAVAADAVGTAAWAVDFVGADLQRERRGGARETEGPQGRAAPDPPPGGGPENRGRPGVFQ